MKSMFGKLITTIAMATAMLLASSVYAQSSVTVRRNGKPVIVVTTKKAPRCETPRQHRAPPRRHVHRCRHVRPVFRYHKHVKRFYNNQNHARNRCSFCRSYDQWLKWKPCKYDPVRHVCRKR